eukprot:527822-Rhodomonas_salina.2
MVATDCSIAQALLLQTSLLILTCFSRATAISMSGGVASGWEGGGGVIPSDAIDPIGPGMLRYRAPSALRDARN